MNNTCVGFAVLKVFNTHLHVDVEKALFTCTQLCVDGLLLLLDSGMFYFWEMADSNVYLIHYTHAH